MKKWRLFVILVLNACVVAVAVYYFLPKGTFEHKFDAITMTTPGFAGNTYDVVVSIRDVTDSDSPLILYEPRLTVNKGEEGTITIGDDIHGYKVTVLVDDSPGDLFTTTTIEILREGLVVWQHQSMDPVK